MKLKKMSRIFSIILAAFFLATIDGGQSFAATYQGPDPNFSSSNVSMNYTVSRDGYTDITQSDFRIYTSRIDQGVTVRIYGYNLCSAQPGTGSYQKRHIMPVNPRTTDETYNQINVNYNRTITTYRLAAPGSGYSDSVSGQRKTWNNCTYSGNQRTDLHISAADLSSYVKNTTIGNDGMYEFTLSVKTPPSATGFVNGFRLAVLNDSRAIISQEAGNDVQRAKDFGIQIATPRDSSTYGDFQIPFGPDCTVPSAGKRAAIYLYDLDNPDSGIQPSTLRLRVSRYDNNRNRLRTESINITGGSVTNSSAGYRVVRAGNLSNVRVEFTVRPEFKYTLDIDRVFNNNTLQLSIPYSTVWFTHDCNNIANTAQLTPGLTLQPSSSSVIPVGGQFRATFVADETGGKFDAEMRSGAARVWRENTNNEDFGLGDERLHADTFRSETIRRGGNFTREFTWTVPDVGSGKICASWDVVAGSNTQLTGDRSITKCKLIGKSPLINVFGGDIRAGSGSSTGDIIGSMTTIGGDLYGSWSEYGMFAPGQISNFASGGVLSNNLRTPGISTSPLTFANSPSSGSFQSTMDARGTPVSSIFDKVDQTNPGTWTTVTGSSFTVPSGSGIHRIRSNSTGQITLNGANNISGVVMIDAPDARVVIGGNIIYSNGPFSSTSQIPLVLINAESIRFVSGVSQVDAGIQTTEEVSTCGGPGATYYEGLKLNSCVEKLQVNGFVSASSLYLRRTAGGDGSTSQQRAVAAETFNLRSDAILKINQMTQGDGISIRTTSITELPPRL